MNFKRRLACSLLTLPLLTGCYAAEGDKNAGSEHRMQNATVVIVTGVAAERVYGDSSIEATIERPYSFDSRISGTTVKDHVDIRVHLPLTDNRFLADRRDGRWVGAQDKLLFDWDVQQIDERSYRIARVGFDGTLEIDMKGRDIAGVYRKPFGLDFSFHGTMSDDGAYRLTLERPLGFDWTVTGKISPPATQQAPGNR